MTGSPIAPGAHRGAEPALRAVPHVLLPYQQAWVADRSAVKIYEKSRRIGVSWAEAADAALHAASRSGSDVFYLAYNLDMTRQFIEDCAWWAKWYDLAAGEISEREIEEVLEDGGKKTIKVFEIVFASGHRVQALSSKPRNLRSKQGRVIFDEFAFHDDPDELLKAALALLIWGGEVRIISTHNGVDNAFYRLIEECRSGKRPYAVHRTTFREAVDQGLYRRIALVKGWEATPSAEAEWVASIYDQYGDGAGEELDVVASKSGGKYFSRVLVEDRMDPAVPVIRLALGDDFAQLPERERVRRTADWLDAEVRPLLARLHPDLKSVAGLDFGRVADLTFLLAAQISPSLARECAFGLELRNVPFETQKQIVFYVLDELPRFVAGSFDARGNGAFLAEVAMQRYGASRIHQVQATNAWYLEHFPRYRAAFTDGSILLPKDADLLDDHGDVELVGGIPKVSSTARRKGADGLPRHADGAIAGVMLWHASINQGAPIEFATLGPRPDALAASDYVAGGDARRGAVVTTTGFGTLQGSHNLRGFY